MILCSLGMIIEFISGYMVVSSLVLISDSTHVVSDLITFLIALIVMKVSRHHPVSNYWSFEYDRMGIFGAIFLRMLI